jgi:sugar/nucleoside kinase (ribokinase family)
MVELDYVVVGHATRDLKKHSFTVGGTAVYAARTALMLGCRVGVITSADTDLDLSEALSDVLVVCFSAPKTTTFENTYIDGRRQQVIRDTAETLVPVMVPDDWRAAIVHIGPVAQECDPALVDAIAEAFVGVTAQGWMRQWDERGQVSHRPWREAEEVLPHADAVVLSEEDIGGDRRLAAEYAAQTKVLALTRGAAGCTVYADDEVHHFAPPAVVEVDSTGAGDIFAASFFYVLQRGHSVWSAARFANRLAAQSVTRPGLSGIPGKGEVARCRRTLLGDEVGDAHHLRAG